MKLNTEGVPGEFVGGVEVGDVYVNQRGKFMLCVAQSGSTMYVVNFDRDGTPVSVGQYGTHYFNERRPVCRVSSMPVLNVEWDFHGRL